MPLEQQLSFDFSNPTAALVRDAEKACDALRRMTGEERGRGRASKSGNDILPIDYIARCKGLLFIVTRGGGLGLSVSRGKGFTIQKLGSVDGQQSWSAPCWATFTDFGLGLTVGYNEIVSIIVLSSQGAVDKMKKSEPTINVDGSIILGRSASIADTLEEGLTSIPFSLADGALLDLSVKGGANMVHTKRNEAAYGQGVTPEMILEGQVPPPPEFASLYILLNDLCARPQKYEELRDSPRRSGVSWRRSTSSSKVAPMPAVQVNASTNASNANADAIANNMSRLSVESTQSASARLL
ncbi:hypothetical protein WJX73_001210 [Symbiochloris irregularis]|uniref:Ysc84 actin-binding domain-containing protein n=1 Tax=Symbiochloris irregularis TaxID=706552 RepID=A0AAW1NW00_9CHLO